ncbi:MAG TPA: DUF4199 domain-containing protein [Leeuwenhoekiella sp.]|nr:DUF4199 domain-containing protein [Leeuwenhoekiella sp.]
METEARKQALNLGLYMGLALILVTTICYVINVGLLANFWVGLFNLIIVFSFAIFSCYSARKIIGFPSFKDVFTSYTITVALGLAISTVFTIILFNLIDTGAAEIIKEQSIVEMQSIMERFNAPQSEIDKAVTQAQNAENNFSIASQTQSYFIFLAIMLLLGLLASLLFRKKDPTQA